MFFPAPNEATTITKVGTVKITAPMGRDDADHESRSHRLSRGFDLVWRKAPLAPGKPRYLAAREQQENAEGDDDDQQNTDCRSQCVIELGEIGQMNDIGDEIVAA